MWLVVTASLAVLVVIYYLFIKSSEYKIKDDRFSYKSKEFLLSKTEKVVYNAFCDYISRHNIRLKIFPKMRLTDFLWSPKDNRNAYLRINGKFIDFLFVEKSTLKPLIAIFIINKDSKAKMFSLDVIEPALESAKIKLVKISSSSVFNMEELNKTVKKALEGFVWH